MATRPPLAQRLEGLLSGASSIGNLGLGLLASSGPRLSGTSSLGTRLAEAGQFASERQRAAMQNEAMRAQLRAQQGREQAMQQLPGLLGQTGGATEEQQQLIGLLGQIAPQQVASDLLGRVLPQQPEEPETPFSKIDPSNFTPESIAAFQETNDYSRLRVREPAPEPTSLETKLGVVRNALGRDLSETEILDAAGISAGEAPEGLEAEQIPPTQLASVRLPDGSVPDIGTTWGQAKEAGAKVFSAADLKRQEDVAGALNTLNELERMALDPDTGVFVDEGGSFLTNNILARLASGISNGLGALAGTESSERRAIFDGASQGTLSGLVRSMGESGALSDGDVRRAQKLIPTLGATPTTERQAKRQFAELRTIISRGQENLERMGGGTGQAPMDLGGGVTLEFLD